MKPTAENYGPVTVPMTGREFNDIWYATFGSEALGVDVERPEGPDVSVTRPVTEAEKAMLAGLCLYEGEPDEYDERVELYSEADYDKCYAYGDYVFFSDITSDSSGYIFNIVTKNLYRSDDYTELDDVLIGVNYNGPL